ncbi:MAG TPA: hypothetical protein VGE07_11375 [Herpetosiphonaceae bacterium]
MKKVLICCLLLALLLPLGAPRATFAATGDLLAYAPLEVTQGVQTYKPSGNVPLVAGKRTFVFFYARVLKGADATTTAELKIQRGSETITVKPLNAGGKVTLAPYLPNRVSGDRQFRFEIPKQFLHGQVTLTAVLNPHKAPAETDYTNNTGQKTVTFEQVPELSLIMYDVQYKVFGHGSRIFKLSDIETDGVRGQRGQMIDWLRSAYPLHKINWIPGSIYMGKKHKQNDGDLVMLCTSVNVAAQWGLKHGGVSPGPNARAYGMVSRSGGYMRGCAKIGSDLVASGPTNIINGDFATSTGDDYGGHELGHIFDRRHPEERPCGEGVIHSGYYPYAGATLSPISEAWVSADQAWGDAVIGVDVNKNMQNPDFFIHDYYDMMSYCDPNRWVSDYSAKKLMDYFQSHFSFSKAAKGAAPAVGMVQDRLAVMGAIDNQTGTVVVEPVYRTPELGDADGHRPGDHAIVLRDDAGRELLRYPFTPAEPGHLDAAGAREQRDGIDPASAAARMTEPRTFDEHVPWVAGASRIDIEGPGGALLHRIQPGASAPSVTLLSPNGGTRVSPTQQELEVRWEARDSDGDPLTYRVEYSADGGRTWTLYTMHGDETSLMLPKNLLAASSTAMVRVSASDGVHTAIDTSDSVFTVLNHAPEISLGAATAGLGGGAAPAAYAQGQTFAVEAYAYDIDQGNLDDAIVWTSSLDGRLDTGALLGTASLSVGTHTLTAEVRDAAGASARAQLRVTIVPALADLPPVPDQLYATPSHITLGVNARSAPVTINNLNPDRALDWRASADQPWIRLSAASGRTGDSIQVAYDPDLLGDGIHEATISLTSPELPGVIVSIPVTADILFPVAPQRPADVQR